MNDGWSRRAMLAGAVSSPLCAAMAAHPGSGDPVTLAFLAAFPLHEMARLGGQTRVGINQLSHRRNLSAPTDRTVTMPNNDTLYSSMWFDLNMGAIDMDLPVDGPDYFSGTVIGAFTDVVAIIGTGRHRINGGRIRLAGPNWAGGSPRDRRLIRCPTADGWFLARIGVPDPTNLSAARAVQDAIKITMVPAVGLALPERLQAGASTDPATLLGVVNNRLRRSDPAYAPARAMRRFAAQGLGVSAPAWPDLPAGMQAAWGDLWKDPTKVISDASRFSVVRDGWSWPDPAVGQFGSDFAYRASIALSGIGALTESEAMYLTAIADTDGRTLVPGGRYRWTIAGGTLPVDAFWSLTAYRAEPDGRFFLHENPIARYAIGDRTPGMRREANGNLVIAIQPNAPAEGTTNWLPTPDGPFRLVLRAYRPDRSFRNRRARPAALQRV
jgi:hypothetical protein